MMSMPAKRSAIWSMLDQIAKGLSPVIGGFIAYLFGPQATLLFTAAIFTLAALPLFLRPNQCELIRRSRFVGCRANVSRRGHICSIAYRQ